MGVRRARSVGAAALSRADAESEAGAAAAGAGGVVSVREGMSLASRGSGIA